MFRSDSPVSSQAGSILSTGYSTMDDVSEASYMSKPSAKSIYMKRREYAASLNQMIKTNKYKVEHLFFCELDGVKLRNISECVERLQELDRLGKVWGQDMMLEVSGVNLLLTDFETKEELESIALGTVVDIKGVLDSSRFRSLLTVSVRPAGQYKTSVYIFQCDDVGADHIQMELSHALLRWSKGLSGPGPSHGEEQMRIPCDPATNSHLDEEEPELAFYGEDYDEVQPSVAPLPPLYTELDRNVDVMNHILNDIEIFMGRVAAVVAKHTKRKKKTKKAMAGMPSALDFTSCLQKIKYGFNLLVELNGKIGNPSAHDFVHYLFSILAYIVQYCPKHLPPTVEAPLLTPQCVHLMSEEASAAEERRWKSLGDAWSIPSTQWPKDKPIPSYTLTFMDGWQPRAVDAESRLNSSLSSCNTTAAPPTTRGSKPERRRVTYNFTSRNHRELTVSKGEVVDLLDVSKLWWKVRNARGEEGFVPRNILEPEEEAQMEHISGPVTLTRVSTPAQVKAWLEQKHFSKITLRCLGVLNGSSLLAMTREELKSLCPEEGGRVFFQLQAVRCALTVDH